MSVDPTILAKAVAAAAAHCKVDPALLMLPRELRATRKGAGRAAILAAAALVSAGWGVRTEVLPLLDLGPTRIAVSQMLNVNLTAEDVAAVIAVIGRPETAARVSSYRSAPDYIDPRRDLAREARILKARREGEGPSAIAAREGVAKSKVWNVLTRSGETFPPLKAGRPSNTPDLQKVQIRKPGRPKGTSAPKRPRTSLQKVQKSAPPPAPVAPPVAIEAFPEDAATWAPLPGSSPCRLVDHVNGCRWPLTLPDARPRDPWVCNAKRHGMTPYCEPHAWLGASPAIRATMVRPAAAATAVRVARPVTDRDLETADVV